MYILVWLYKSNHVDPWNNEPIINQSMITFDRKKDAIAFVESLVTQNEGLISNIQLYRKVPNAFKEQLCI